MDDILQRHVLQGWQLGIGSLRMPSPTVTGDGLFIHTINGLVEGKILTGNHRFFHEIWDVPVIFPLNQSVDTTYENGEDYED